MLYLQLLKKTPTYSRLSIVIEKINWYVLIIIVPVQCLGNFWSIEIAEKMNKLLVQSLGRNMFRIRYIPFLNYFVHKYYFISSGIVT